MGLAEYPEGMSEVKAFDAPEAEKLFRTLHEKATKIHTGEVDELNQFKSIMDRLISIEKDLDMIKKHFHIVPIVGEAGRRTV